MTSTADIIAAQILGPLWAAYLVAGGGRPPIPCHRHFTQAYDPGWLARLPLPIADERPEDQPVALVEGSAFERHHHADAIERAYSRRPRTHVYEGIDLSSSWIGRVALHLTRLTASAPPVAATAYASTTGDATIRAHADSWDGLIVQLAGAKRWQLGPGLQRPGERIDDVTTAAGDILILPDGEPHAVATPAAPGHSLHVVFAVRRRVPTAHDLELPGEPPGERAAA